MSIRSPLLILLAVYSALAGNLVAQATPLNPLAVVDLNQVVQRDLGFGPLEARGVAQSSGQWAIMMKPVNGHTVMVVGTGGQAKAVLLDGRFDQIAMDQDRHIHLRYQQTSAERRTGIRALVANADGSLVRSIVMPSTALMMVNSGTEVKWLTEGGVFSPEDVPAKPPAQSPRLLDPNRPEVEGVAYLGLPGNSYVSLAPEEERLTLFGADGIVVGSNEMHLDDAYRKANLEIHRHAPGSGEVRIVWAAAPPDGLVYVCLSDAPVSGPAYLAAVDPANGEVRNVFSALLPQAVGRREPQWNPRGTITPFDGAIGDQVVIVDPRVGIAAIYPFSPPK